MEYKDTDSVIKTKQELNTEYGKKYSKPTRLTETVYDMVSDNYKDRFKAEYYQLLIRRRKLAATISDAQEGLLGFDLSCPLGLLTAQLSAMDTYMLILKERARIEGIEL